MPNFNSLYVGIGFYYNKKSIAAKLLVIINLKLAWSGQPDMLGFDLDSSRP